MKTISALIGRTREEHGSATVELALVLPLVLTMTLALLQVGLLVKDQLVVVGSARAGAREASVSTEDSSVRDAVVEAAASLSPRGLDVAVHRSGGMGGAVKVSVVYHARPAIPVVQWLFPSSIDLSATATMRQEVE